MPEQVVRDHFGRQPFDAYNGGEASIAHVARELDVSVQALTIRLTRLGLISA